MSNVLSFSETSRALEAFLEVAIHTLLFARNVYPPNIFRQHQKYGIPVWQSRSPQVNEYVSTMCGCIGQELNKRTLRKVIILIREDGPSETPYERFVFDVEWLVHAESIKDGRDFTPASGGVTRQEMDELMRGFIVRVEGAKTYLKELPDNVTFSVVLEMRDGVEPQSTLAKKGIAPSEWYRAESRHSAEEDSPIRSRLVPHQTTNLGMVQVQFLAEQLELEGDQQISSAEVMTSTDESAAQRRRSEKGKARAD